MYEPLTVSTQSLLSKYVRTFVVVALYWVVSISTVFVNKTLLSSSTVNLDAPLFITWFQCIVSTTICFGISWVSKIFPNVVSFPESSPLNINTFRTVLPLSLLFTMMVATNNLCLKYVGVAFYFVGRSLTTVFNVALTFFLLHQKTSFQCILCCGAIVFCFLLGVDQESLSESFSWRGVFFGVLGSLSLAMYSIHTKKVLVYVQQEIWLLSYYNNLYSTFLFLPLIIINGELPTIYHYENKFAWWFITAMLVSGLCGFLIGLVTALQIKVTSPLTHNISGTAKACAQTVIATQWFNETKTTLWWISNGVVLLASAAYTRVRQLEMQRHHNRQISLKA